MEQQNYSAMQRECLARMERELTAIYPKKDETGKPTTTANWPLINAITEAFRNASNPNLKG